MKLKIFYKKFLSKPINLNFTENICFINGYLISTHLNLKKNNYCLIANSKNQILLHKNYIKTFFSLLLKTIDGISYGFKAILHLKGKGLRLQLKKINFNEIILYLKLGYSHKIFFKLPQNVWLQTFDRRRSLILFSLNYFQLRYLLKQIRNYYPVNLYKIRGFYEPTEIIKQKKGKSKLNG